MYLSQPTTDKRASGKALRASVPRSSHATQPFKAAPPPRPRHRSTYHASCKRHVPWLTRSESGHDFYVRQLRDMKIGVDIEALSASE